MTILIKKYLLVIYCLSLVIALILLVASALSTSWIIIETNEEIHLGNFTKYFSKFTVNKDEKFDVRKTFKFGLQRFCMETYYEQLKTTEKDCKSISIFTRDPEKDALEDALKFHILSIILACLPLASAYLISCIKEGPVKKVVLFSTIAVFVVSGACLISSAIMVKNTLTPESSLVRNNIMAHIGHAEVDLENISRGSAYSIIAAAFAFLVISLMIFAYKFLVFDKKHGSEEEQQQTSNYRLLLSQQ